MNFHLIRSKEVDRQLFFKIYNLLSKYPGGDKYIIHENENSYDESDIDWNTSSSGDDLITETWEKLFSCCDFSRQEYKIPEEDYVVWMTDKPNDHNYFSAADFKTKNAFLHTGDWDHYMNGDETYALMYELSSMPLQVRMCESFEELEGIAHEDPRGCMNDFCKKKEQVSLKLRTGDICVDCLRILKERNVDGIIVKKAFDIFDGIRKELLQRNFLEFDPQCKTLIIDVPEQKITIPELNLDLKLDDLGMTFYHFFISLEKNITYRQLKDHKAILVKLYRLYSNAESLAYLENTIVNYCNNPGFVSTLVSRLNKRLREVIPPSIADYYTIGGEKGMPRKITLDRKYVKIRWSGLDQRQS